MTKWELGQDLIAIADLIFEAEDEMKEIHPEVASRLRLVRALVGDIFKDHNDHGFGILSSHDLK